jgi:Predicted transcriptional regulators
MNYTISQIAEKFNVEPHTLRFYEKEGIITPERSENGIRVFTDENISQLELVMCLKSTGMPLRDIKRYFDMVSSGDDMLEERLEIFVEQKEHVLNEIEVLKKYLKKIEHKISWYTDSINKKRVNKSC